MIIKLKKLFKLNLKIKNYSLLDVYIQHAYIMFNF